MSACGCKGNCGCSRLSTVQQPVPAVLRKPTGGSTSPGQRVVLRNDDGNPCGSGGEPRRVLLTARGNIRRYNRAAVGRRQMVAGLGEVPVVTGADGRTRINGAALHAERLALRFQGDRKADRPGPTDTLRPADPGGLRPVDGAILLGERSKRGMDVELGYRATTFTVPLSWFMSYRRDLVEQHRRLAEGRDEAVGKVSSVSDGEHFAFSDLLAAFGVSGADSAVWLEMLGCYNLPRATMPTDMDAMFWAGGWGPPYRVYELTNMLVLSTSGLIDDPCTGHPNCRDLGDWIQGGLRGRWMTDLLGKGPCRLRFRFMNRDTVNAFVGDSTSTVDLEGCGFTRPTFCDRGFLVVPLDLSETYDGGNFWNFGFPPTFDDSAKAWIAQGRVHPWRSMSLPGVEGITAYVRDGTMTVTQRPELLAWESFVVDWILYLSRLAWDYSRDTETDLSFSERAVYRDHALNLGRYALRILAARGRLLIHELGHAHNGRGGHCSNGECCFELSSQRWLCALSAKWGLPINSGTSAAASTWTNSEVEYRDFYCLGLKAEAGPIPVEPPPSPMSGTPPSTVGFGVSLAPLVYCSLHEPGHAGTGYTFACSSCSSPNNFQYDYRLE